MAVWNEVQYSNINLDRFDAEYFRKDFEENLSFLQKTGSCRRLGTLFSYIKRGSQPKYNENGTIRVLRSVNVGFMNFNKTRQEYVTQQFLNTNARGGVEKNDILVTSTGVGTLGRTSIWHFDKPAYCDGHITILRNGVVDPFMVTAFLNSKYGLMQFDQNYRGSSGQIEIYPFDISKIVIPELLFEYEREIGDYLRKSFKLQKESKKLYSQATELLDNALGLNDIQFKKEKCYTATLNEIILNNRADAEFFDVKFNLYLEKIYQYQGGTTPLIQVCERVLPNFDSTKEKLNKIFYIEIGDVNISNGTFEFKEIDTKDAPANAKIILQGGEVLISMVRPTRGAIAIVPDNLPEGKVVCSGAFYVFKPKDIEKREIIWLYLRIIKNLFERYCGGTSYPVIEPCYLSFIPIPNFSNNLSIEISALIKLSVSLINESKELLEQAKLNVESLIEKAAERL